MLTLALYLNLEILKVHDQINLLNCLFVHDFLNGNLPKSFDNTFTKLSDIRSNDNTVSTINSQLGCLFLPNVNTSTYGLNSLYRNSIISWNSYIKLFNRWLTALTKIKFVEKYIPRMNAGLEKATPSAMPVQPRTRAGLTGRHRAKQ